MKKFYFLAIAMSISLLLLNLNVNAQSFINAKGVTFDIPGATSTYITCTNDSNDLGGYYILGGNSHGFYYDAHAIDTFYINYPGATNTWVYGINNAREMVGAYNSTGLIADNEGFKYSKNTNTYSDITSSWISSMTVTIARAINDAGCVVGDYKESTTHVGFSMCGGNNTPVNYNYNPTYLYGLNNAGKAVGFWMDVNNASLHNGLIRDAGGSWDSLNYPGATKTHLCGINDSDFVVGIFNTTHSFIYKNGVFKEVKKTGVTDFQLQDINNYGMTVGYYKNGTGNYSGFYMPMCDIGFRPNPNGWQFNNSEENLWPESWWQQIDYNTDPYRYGAAPFPKINISGQQTVVQNWLFPDWKLFVETFGELNCYTTVNNIPIIKNNVFHKWYNLTDHWGGSCFGFTQSSFMAWDSLAQFKWNYPGVGPWTANNKLYELPINYHNRRCINQLQLKQQQKAVFNFYNQDGTLTPNETLKRLKIRLLDGNKDEGGLIFFNQNPGGGGHIVCPYKIEIDTLNPNIEYIYVYDNNQPGDTTRRVKVNKTLNSWYYNLSGNAALTQCEWGGDNAHKGMFVCWPASSFYAQSNVDSLKKINLKGNQRNNTFDIYNSTHSNIIINDLNGNVTSFINNILINNIQGASPMVSFIGNEIPHGYLLPESSYNVEMKDFSDSIVKFSLFTDNDSYSFTRGNALLFHKDKFQIDVNGIKFINTDNVSKSINVESIADDMGSEKTFTLSQMPLHASSNILFSIIANDKLEVVNVGAATRYHLKLQLLSPSGVGLFEHDTIHLDANTTHIISMNWSNILNADLQIYVDNNNDGINDDTLYFNNQGIPVIVTNPTLIQQSAALHTDTIFIGNMGSGTMTWTASSDATAWLTIAGSNTGTNFGYVRYTTTANTGAARVGHITVASVGASNSPYVIEVNQEGVLTVPAGLTASDGTFSDGVHVSWTQVSGATHYMLYRSDNSGDYGTALTGWITALNYVDNTALNGVFYYYTVKAAQNASGLNATAFSNTDDGWRPCFTANFTTSGVCLGQPTTFTDMSSVHTNAYFLWDIDNNGTIDYTGSTCSHTYTTTGAKTITLTVTDSSLCTNTFQKTINILAFPSVNLLSDTSLCASQSVTLNAGSGFSSYLWSTGATASSVTVDSTGFGLGKSSVYVSVTNANGCSAIDTTVITWNICTEISAKQLKDFAVNIYPNPTNSLLNVAIEGNISEMKVDLFNFNGQSLYNQVISEIDGHYNFTIDTKQFKSGIYFLRCISDNRVEVKKVIIY